jgi:serine protease AprX
MLRRRQQRLVALAISVVLTATAAVGAAGAGAQTTSGATLSKPLASWLATASAAATHETIVTFDTYDGMRRIDTLGAGAVKLKRLPIAFATLTAAQVREVAAWPETRSLWHDQRNRPILAESVPLIGADRVHAGTKLRRPYTGAGVNVAVIDTGVDGLHPDLPAGTKVEQYALAGNPFDREPMVLAPLASGDTYGHGTHVSSTIAGLGAASAGRYAGVAPGATITSFKTDVGLFLFNSYILASFDWILSRPEKGIRVSSNSWGCCDGQDYDPDDPINFATKALYDAGVAVVFAAGNSGGPDTLNTYATSPWVISVAAGTKNRALSSFSSRGEIDGNWDRRKAQRTDTGVYRPTLTAPGEDIKAAKSSHAVVMAGGTDPANPMYTTASGTSMAAPHVAGAIALMLEARPKLEPKHVIRILEGTAADMPAYEIFEAGIGYLDAYAAVRAAERGKVRFPPPITGKTPQFRLTSSTAFGGTVASGTWVLRRCPDTTGLLSHHTFTISSGIDAIYAEIEWADPNQLIYLVLWDPSCQVAGESAALLDIGSVNHRAVVVTSPAAGTWTVGVYGRINIPTQYAGAFSVYDKR